MTHEVKGCTNCCFAWTKSGDHFSCSAPKAMRLLITPYVKNIGDGDKFPVWCPLKKEDIVIQLEKQ